MMIPNSYLSNQWRISCLLSLLVASWFGPSSSEAGIPQEESRTAHAVRVDRAPKLEGVAPKERERRILELLRLVEMEDLH